MVKSMFAAVAGLRTHQARMDVIGNNIANVNTYGFKKARASFRDQFYQTMSGASEAGNVYGGGNPSQVGYGAWMASVDVNFGTGSGAPTGYGMDAMIAGNGFFVVGTYNAGGFDRVGRASETGGGLDITALRLTRVGIFNIDGQGNLVDSMSHYVYGFANNSQIGGDRLEMLKVPQILMRANGDPVMIPGGGGFITIPYQMMREDDDDPTSDLLDPPRFRLDNTQNPPQKMLLGYDPETGEYDFDEDGELIAHIMGLFDELAPRTTPGPPPVLSPWTEEEVLAHLGFDSGTGTDPVPDPEFYMTAMKLNNISIAPDGTVRGSNDLGQTINIGKIAVANVPNPNALLFEGNGYYKADANTGVVTGEIPGEGTTGVLNAGYLEMANVDLAQEFTDMIITQRGFQANGRIITVTDEMLAELVNLKR